MGKVLTDLRDTAILPTGDADRERFVSETICLVMICALRAVD